jgi:sugar phosphate isomerase/epimerase
MRHFVRLSAWASAVVFVAWTSSTLITAASPSVGYCVNLDRLEAVQGLGFDYLEVPAQAIAALSEDEYAALRQRVAALEVPVRAANVFLPGSLKVTGPEADPAKQVEYVRKCLDRLAGLGVRTLVFGSGGARRVPDGFSRDEATKQIVTFGKMAAQEAASRNITIVLEPLRSQESNIVNTAGEGLKIVRAVNHPNFRILVDFYHLAEEKEDPAVLLEAGDLLKHVHVANPAGRVFPMKADEAAYAPFFANLRKIGYAGGVSVEARTENIEADAPAAIALLRQFTIPSK